MNNSAPQYWPWLNGCLALGRIHAGHASRKASHRGVIRGGLIFGSGFALAGFCTGTAICARGSGSRQAMAFVLGGLLGAALFSGSYALLKQTALLLTGIAWKLPASQQDTRGE